MKLYRIETDPERLVIEVPFNQEIAKLASGDKDYCYHNGNYYSFNPNVKILSIQESIEHFNNWLWKEYDKINKIIEQKVDKWRNRRFNNQDPIDILEQFTMQAYNRINKGVGVNKYMPYLLFVCEKMAGKDTLIQPYNTETNLNVNLYINDEECITVDAGIKGCFFDDFVVLQDRMVYEDYSCVNDVNISLLVDEIKDFLRLHYKIKKKRVAIKFVDFIEHFMQIKGKHNIDTDLLDFMGLPHDKEELNYYRGRIFKKILKDIIDNKDTILSNFEKSKYKSFDDYELKDLIEA